MVIMIIKTDKTRKTEQPGHTAQTGQTSQKEQTGQTDLTFKLDVPGNLCKTAFAILAMFILSLLFYLDQTLGVEPFACSSRHEGCAH